MKTKNSIVKSATAVSYKSLHCSKTCKSLYLDESSADVKFVFLSSDGIQQHLPAHKFLLAHGSPVFKAMFTGGLKEADKVEIVDATFNEFKEFIQVFYMDEIALTMENVAGVMILANKYDIAECLDLCEKFLIEHVSLDVVCSAFDLAIALGRNQLKEVCQRKVTENSSAIFASDSFRQCSQDVLKQILERGDLSCSAKEIFDACMVWAGQTCVKNGLNASIMENRKKHLGECLYLIPFHLMRQREINECISIHKALFDHEELIEIVSIITLGASYAGELKKFKVNKTFKTAETKAIEGSKQKKASLEILTPPPLKSFTDSSPTHESSTTRAGTSTSPIRTTFDSRFAFSNFGVPTSTRSSFEAPEIIGNTMNTVFGLLNYAMPTTVAEAATETVTTSRSRRTTINSEEASVKTRSGVWKPFPFS